MSLQNLSATPQIAEQKALPQQQSIDIYKHYCHVPALSVQQKSHCTEEKNHHLSKDHVHTGTDRDAGVKIIVNQ